VTAAFGTAILFWAYCGILGVLVKRDPPFLQNGFVQLSSIMGYFLLAGAVAWTFVHTGHPLVTVPGFVLVLFLGVGLGYRYLAFLIHEGVDRLHAASTGIDQMTVRKTYDRAEKARREGDLDRAVDLYREEAARDPADPEPHQRMAEIDLGRGRIPAALEGFRQALARMEKGEAEVTLAFRLSDLLEKEGNTRESRQILEGIERKFEGTKFAEYARERLGKPIPPEA
jgi:hypothetical protein